MNEEVQTEETDVIEETNVTDDTIENYYFEMDNSEVVDQLVSLNEKTDAIYEQLETLNNYLEIINSGLANYFVIWIPLAVIVLSLYWFFKQFMDRY